MLRFQLPGAPGGNLLEHLLLESIGAKSGGAIFAWTNSSGVKTFFGDSVIHEMLKQSEFDLVVGTDTITDSKAIEALRDEESSNSNFKVKAFLSPVSSLFHPKLAWYEHENYLSLIVGSGNLTMGGLLANWEAMTITHLTGVQASEARASIAEFMSSHSDSLYALTDQRVIDRVEQNNGNERTLRVSPPDLPDSTPDAQSDAVEALVAEIPAAGGRWSQANFDRANYEEFFGAKVGSQRRIVLQHVSLDGTLGAIESRQSVEVASQNYRFELAAAKGIKYPANGAPIGVFLRLATGQFLYTVLLPSDDGYDGMVDFLENRWSGPKRQKRRVRTSASDLHSEWKDSPLWQAQVPDL